MIIITVTGLRCTIVSFNFSNRFTPNNFLKNSAMKPTSKEINVREIRRKLGLNQQQFWTKIGVTQSGGSRYESGRNMPKPVKELLRLVHVEQIDLNKIKREDVEIVELLKSKHSDMYKELKKTVKANKK